MNNSIKNIIFYWIAIFIFACLVSFFVSSLLIENQTEKLIENEQFGGYIPMKVYQIFDRDTGVYYAVTEKGGICVMETMEGKTKLVEQGDGAIIHPNKGESDAQKSETNSSDN